MLTGPCYVARCEIYRSIYPKFGRMEEIRVITVADMTPGKWIPIMQNKFMHSGFFLFFFLI